MANQSAVSEALARLGFEPSGHVRFGLWDGYAVTVRHSAPYYDFDLAVRADRKDKSAAKAVRARLKERCGKTVLGCVNHGDHFTFPITLHKKPSVADQLETALNEITAAMRAQSVAPADTCAVCGREHPDSCCLVSTYQPVHAACVRTTADAARQESAGSAQQGSYLTGIVGAVLGVLVGLVPSLLSILLFDRIYTALFVIVPLLAALGYRRFRGKRSGESIGIIILLSLAGVVLLELLAVTISFKQEFGMTFVSAMRFTLNNIFTRIGIGVLLQENLAELFFMAIGVFIAWPFLSRSSRGREAQAETASRTLHPLSGSADDPDWSEK